ncbi:MAG: peptidoglycan-binding protein, partial [Acetanaerobacterium sp.]
MQDKIIKVLKIGIIVALNLCIISLVVYTSTLPAFDSEAVDVLSKIGSQGDEVKQIQSNLKKWGYYSGAVDGIYGSKTEKAVRWFQQKNGLTVDGIAGPQTLAAIGISGGSSGGSSSGDSSSGGGSKTAGASATSKDQALLARIISAEARGEPYTGQVAVGACVLNRVK